MTLLVLCSTNLTHGDIRYPLNFQSGGWLTEIFQDAVWADGVGMYKQPVEEDATVTRHTPSYC